MNRRIVACARCGHNRQNRARGLCNSCLQYLYQRGGIDAYPRTTRSADEVLEEWDFLRHAGTPPEQAAALLGMAYESFERALFRAKRRGDVRAVGFTRHKRQAA